MLPSPVQVPQPPLHDMLQQTQPAPPPGQAVDGVPVVTQK
jgi:hypothetical protein